MSEETSGSRILLVEDDHSLRLALRDRLASEGYRIETAADGDQGALAAREGLHDLIILDVMLPGRSGFDIVRELRRRRIETPILMLTARGELTDKVLGLQLGADDYMTKPFEFMELLARIEAMLRRPALGSGRPSEPFTFGRVQVNLRSAEVLCDGKPVQLSAREFRLLCYFIENRDVVLSRNDLLDAVWGYDAMPTTRTVDVHVARLRQRLEVDPAHPRYILTVRGLGYRFSPRGE
ncbi:MAG TPA: response regulator transcription factor [Vicinamibacteria bacterium]|nr:response regulator transcription factor [Vicinamibacteria bacterium]